MQIYNNYMAIQMVRYGIASFLRQKTIETAQPGSKDIYLYPIVGLYSFHW